MSFKTTYKTKSRLADACDELITKTELAKKLKVSTRTVDAWREQGVISCIKIASQVRFDWNEVLEEIKERKEVVA